MKIECVCAASGYRAGLGSEWVGRMPEKFYAEVTWSVLCFYKGPIQYSNPNGGSFLIKILQETVIIKDTGKRIVLPWLRR